MEVGYSLPEMFINNYLMIIELYHQQKYMFNYKLNRIVDRIASILQQLVRPIK